MSKAVQQGHECPVVPLGVPCGALVGVMMPHPGLMRSVSGWDRDHPWIDRNPRAICVGEGGGAAVSCQGVAGCQRRWCASMVATARRATRRQGHCCRCRRGGGEARVLMGVRHCHAHPPSSPRGPRWARGLGPQHHGATTTTLRPAVSTSIQPRPTVLPPSGRPPDRDWPTEDDRVHVQDRWIPGAPTWTLVVRAMPRGVSDHRAHCSRSAT